MMTVRFTAAVVTIWSVCLEASAFNAIDSVPSPDAFPIDTTLQCITLSGPEELPNVRLIPVQDSQILQPEPSRFVFPLQDGDQLPVSAEINLIPFIAPDLNTTLQDLRRQNHTNSSAVVCSTEDPTMSQEILDEINGVAIANGFPDGIEQLGADFPEQLSDNLRILSCDQALRADWSELPITFYPRYFLGQYCNPRVCSYPGDNDQSMCTPDLNASTNLQVTVLRWDCCWSLDMNNQYKFLCGWRKVQFPIVCDCDCTCG